MTRSSFLGRLGLILAGAVILAVVLRLVIGARWFGFYGAATVTLLLLPLLALTLAARYRALGKARWPVVLLIVPAGAMALVQAGYWWAFFNLGPAGIPLGVIRVMTADVLALARPAATLGLALVALWLVARGLGQAHGR